MKRVLAVDTTAEFGSIAAAEDGRVVEEILLHGPDGFGHVLFAHLGRLLERLGWRVADIHCFAAAAGPGSFTGVRVGLAAAKGLAAATGRKAAAVSNLKAIASLGRAPLRAAIIDARRGEVYAAVFDAALRERTPETVQRLPDFLRSLPDGEIEFLASDFTPFAGALPAGARACQTPRALAAAIALLASDEEGEDPAALDANYVRRSDAELFWRDR
ncbi:MAG: tRNA (adenosine(37)-N6)-threonylcarbamoyltransferase complex dimerization subunit type 1 TsaB [Bryobacteraceae bacterium]|nr:tRNA (adenosine(37)-N6)-threonylcarbamoyltransferase complex dimerization subunit type 1 TsaB [Bryobacteraceae bacterium]